MYVCKDYNGNHFIASEQLEAALDRESVRAPVNVPLALTVQTGTQPGTGLRYAVHGDYRVVTYAEGGYCCQWQDPATVGRVGWFLFASTETMPEDIERALCFALGIAYEPD